MSERRGRALVRAAWTLLVALLAILCLKIFVCDVKHVESGSMEPTIFGSREGGESVLVLFGKFQPARFDCVVLQREGEDVPIVKRVVGLPTESVRISQGDLLVDGRRLPPSAPRPAPILVFDGTQRSLAEVFEPARGLEGLWAEAKGQGRVVVDAEEVAPRSGEGLTSFHPPVHDDYFTLDGTLVRGELDVNDLIFECDAVVLRWAPGGKAIVELTEQGDTFRFELERWDEEQSTARISRARGDGSEEILASKLVRFSIRKDGGGPPSATWPRIRCANIDNALSFQVGDDVLCCAYAENSYAEGDRLKEGKTFGVRVRFGGEGGFFGFGAVRILRDMYYVPLGAHGVTTPAELGPSEYFVLGDNSASSRDSREWGPVQAAKIVGRPVSVVWPPSSIRWLPAAVPGPCGP